MHVKKIVIRQHRATVAAPAAFQRVRVLVHTPLAHARALALVQKQLQLVSVAHWSFAAGLPERPKWSPRRALCAQIRRKSKFTTIVERVCRWVKHGERRTPIKAESAQR